MVGMAIFQYASAPGDSNKCYYVLNLFKRIIGYWNRFIKSYLSLDAWTDHLKLWISKTRNWYYGEKRTQGVEDEKEIHAYFAESTHIHSPKPESVQFNVGQVIIHRRFGYSGVIVGWDVKARAPEEWLQHKYPPEKQGLRDTPHYRILINQANSFSKSTAYIPEEDITIIMGLEVVSFFIHNPDLTTYFSRYDGSKYIMQPWLRKIYPHD
ncbi:F-box only protein 21-like isoform X4 [Malaclemys terrapin pileata]|uniref:F-box only protein 21-like isoform X4 n=1 Tax=Malaclemys terrapin pileata TaxID=2991368 RepID=UPI0023A7DE61|nr:F-box only protein 21-like isoform X4 [Malaclemys terrapin pileata]